MLKFVSAMASSHRKSGSCLLTSSSRWTGPLWLRLSWVMSEIFRSSSSFFALYSSPFLMIAWRRAFSASAREISKAEAEKQRLQAIIKKGEDYKAKKELLERKITLITQLKRNQSGPVHLLDEVSKQLPDFLWLDALTESGFNIQIQGKATTYNAVSNFYNNLAGSRYFQSVTMGPIAAIPVGVTFSLTCQFLPHPAGTPDEGGAVTGG